MPHPKQHRSIAPTTGDEEGLPAVQRINPARRYGQRQRVNIHTDTPPQTSNPRWMTHFAQTTGTARCAGSASITGAAGNAGKKRYNNRNRCNTNDKVWGDPRLQVRVLSEAPACDAGARHESSLLVVMWPPEPGKRGIMGGAEQLQLFDSPVSGMVLATHQGAQQECNRPDQLRQCRDHCYSDLGFLLPIQTQPPHSRRPMAFRHHPVTSSCRCQLPGRNTAGPGSTPRRPHNSLTHTHQRH